MRTAHILGRRHGSKKLEVVGSLDAPIQEAKESFKNFLRSGSHPAYEYVELWEGSPEKKRKLTKPVAKKPQPEKSAAKE